MIGKLVKYNGPPDGWLKPGAICRVENLESTAYGTWLTLRYGPGLAQTQKTLEIYVSDASLTQSEIDSLFAATDCAYAGRAESQDTTTTDPLKISAEELDRLLEDIGAYDVPPSPPDSIEREATFVYSDDAGSLTLCLELRGVYTPLYGIARDKLGMFAAKLFPRLVERIERENRAAGTEEVKNRA